MTPRSKAMGLDMSTFLTNPLINSSVSVFDEVGVLIETFIFSLPGTTAERTFFGYQAPSIGSVVLTNSGDQNWSPLIDDHAYGVPEPATLSLLAFGGLAMLRRRRR